MTLPLSHDDFARRVAELYPKVYLGALAVARDADTAQDVTQEAFLRAYLRLDKLSRAEELGPWVYGIARKVALQWQRDNQNRSRLVPLIPLEEVAMHPPDGNLSPRESAERSEMSKQVGEAVMKLPQELREVLLLHYAEGMTASDIARLNGEAVSTITRRLDKAIGVLRALMEQGLASGLAALRPPAAQAQRTIALVAATAGLSAGAKAQLLGLTAGHVVAQGARGMVSQSVDRGGVMKTFFAATPGKLAAVGLAVLVGGTVMVRSLGNQAGRPATAVSAAELHSIVGGAVDTRIGKTPVFKGAHEGSAASDNDTTGGRRLDRSRRFGEYQHEVREQERARAKARKDNATTTALLGRIPRPDEIPRVNQMESTGTIAGFVYDPEGKPLFDAQVKTYAWWFPDPAKIPTDIDMRLVQPTQAQLAEGTDETGRFELKYLPYGSKLNIAVMTEDYAIHTQAVDVPAENLKIRLQPASKRVYGRVLNLKDDSPVSGARVDLLISGDMEIPFGAEVRKGAGVFGTNTIRTNEDGVFETLRLRDCVVQIDAETTSLALVSSEGSVHKKMATVTAGEEAQEIPPIYVYEGHRVVGVVRDATTKEPIADAIVSAPFTMGMSTRMSGSTLSLTDGGPNAVTDEGGWFELTGVRPPVRRTEESGEIKSGGFNRVSASHPDYITDRQGVEVKAVDRESLEIRLDFELTKKR